MGSSRMGFGLLSAILNKRGKIMSWKNMSVIQKIATIISFAAVAVWLICQIEPTLLPFDATYPAIAVFTGCEAVACWKERRVWSYVLIGGAVICLACFILEQFFLK